MKRQVFRSQLSFTKGELQRACLKAGVGFNLPVQVLSETQGRFSKESFGWSSDSNKFFPALDIKNDVVPKPEDFIDVPFRLISATIVAGGTWRATDFSKGSVLRDSFQKLEGKPVYKDHDTDIDNWVGVVRNPKWTEAFTDKDGVKIPAGIDGILQIDAKTNPKIARGVLSGGIFSNSVTVDFDWIPSHDIDNQYEFENLVGTYASDGRMITREVVQVHDYYESSLCWLGADPYAKLIDKEGNLVNVDLTSTYDQENENVRNGYKKEGKYSISLSLDKNALPLSKMKNSNSNNSKSMEEVLKALRAQLGLSADAEITPAMVLELKKVGAEEAATAKKAENFSKLTKIQKVSLSSDATTPIVEENAEEVKDNIQEEIVAVGKEDFSKLQTAFKLMAELKVDGKEVTKDSFAKLTEEAGKVAGLTTQIETLKTEKQNAEDALAKEKPMADEGRAYIQMKKDEAIRLYKVNAGTAASEAVVELFKNAQPEALEGLLALHTKGATAKFSGRCKKCGSEEFEFKSSLGTGEGGSNVEEQPEEIGVSFNDIHRKYDKPNQL